MEADWLGPGPKGAVAAGKAAESLMKASVGEARRLVSAAGYGAEVDQIIRGYLDGRSPAPRGLEAGSEAFFAVRDTGMESAGERRWVEGGKVVYRLDPELFAALRDTDPSAEIPVEVFGRIPHPSPVFLFPEPVTLVEGPDVVDIWMMLVVGVQARGRQVVVSTADPFDELLALFVAETTRDGESTWEVRRHVLRIAEGRTVEDMAALSASLFRADIDSELVGEVLADHTTQLLRLTVATVLYVASAEPDLAEMEVPVRKKAKGRQRAGRVPTRVVDVGWRVGPGLRAAREGVEGSGLGGSVRSHLRRAHWRRARVGPRADWHYELRWIGPVVVNAEDDDGDGTVITIT